MALGVILISLVFVVKGHMDWIFSVEWIDDFHLATG